MAFTRVVSVQGNEVIGEKNVEFNYTYTNGVPPERINFYINESNLAVYGSVTSTALETYNVNGGIMDSSILTLVETRAKAIIKAYDTIE
ncbi:MAG: hypothetical protein ACRDD8_11320 [Bacteroidales bacterium]